MRRAIAVLLLLALPLTGCHKWTPPEARPNVGADRARTYDRVRVSTADEETLVLYDVRLQPDSVIGYDEVRNPQGYSRLVRLARGDVARLEVRRTDTVATVLTVLGVGAGVVVGFGLVCAATGCIEIGGLSH